MSAYWVDILAVGFFALEWTVYAVTLEHTAYGRDSLSARMHVYREIWMRRMLEREARMVDMQIMASLQNGTAFFASTSLLAVGGALALLRSTNDALAVLHALPIDLVALAGAVGNQMRRADPDLHLCVLQIRLGLPAVQLCRDPARRDAAGQPARHAGSRSACDCGPRRLFEAAGRHFNRGQRAFFFALGYLGWFVSPWVLFRDDRRGRDRHLAPAIRLERLAGDGELGIGQRPSLARKILRRED